MDANNVLSLMMFYLQQPDTRSLIIANLQNPLIQQSAVALFGRAPSTLVDLALLMSEFMVADSVSQIPYQVPTPADPAPAPANSTPANIEFDEALIAILAEIPDDVWVKIDTL